MTGTIEITIRDGETVTAVAYPANAGGRIGVTFVLAHGAGAGQFSPFIVKFAIGLSSRGVDVMTFNFLYTERRRRLPDRTDRLEACFRAVIDAAQSHAGFDGNFIFAGGKSMGGRIASHLAAAERKNATTIKGLVFLGYPLHPPGKPQALRAVHLPKIHVPMLFVQGAHDPFGTSEELLQVLPSLRAPVTLRLVERGDHSLAPPKGSGTSVEQIYEDIQDAIVKWMNTVITATS